MNTSEGFTLVEMSIVLVVIGLILGGILVGRDMIRAAAIRAQLSQIEKYQTAVNTFYGKYQALPGDMNARVAATNGFAARGSFEGQGDGNGVVEGNGANANWAASGLYQNAGETAMLWVDLSHTGLIDGGFNTASSTAQPAGTTSGTGLNLYFPLAKLNALSFVFIGSSNGINYFFLQAVSSMNNVGWIYGQAGITVKDAYDIDRKIDDGLPQSGRVIAQYETWCGSSSLQYAWGDTSTVGSCGHTATNRPSSYAISQFNTATCYNNSNIAGTPTIYTLQNAERINCDLTFQFQ